MLLSHRLVSIACWGILAAFLLGGCDLAGSPPTSTPTPTPTTFPATVPTDSPPPDAYSDPGPVEPFPTLGSNLSMFTGTFIADARPLDVDFLSLTQSGNQVSGYVTFVTQDGNGSTTATTIPLGGTADNDVATLSRSSILGTSLYTVRRTGDQLTLSYPTNSGQIGSRTMTLGNEEGFNYLLSTWRRELALLARPATSKAFLGVSGEPVEWVSSYYLSSYNILDENGMPPQTGWLVETVVNASAAERAGVEFHDVILQVDSYTLDGDHLLVDVLTNYAPNDKVNLKILRAGKVIEVGATLGTRK